MRKGDHRRGGPSSFGIFNHPGRPSFLSWFVKYKVKHRRWKEKNQYRKLWVCSKKRVFSIFVKHFIRKTAPKMRTEKKGWGCVRGIILYIFGTGKKDESVDRWYVVVPASSLDTIFPRCSCFGLEYFWCVREKKYSDRNLSNYESVCVAIQYLYIPIHDRTDRLFCVWTTVITPRTNDVQ